MKKINLLLLFFCCFHAGYAQLSNRYVFDFQGYGIPMADVDGPAGILFSAGYEVHPIKKHKGFAVEPHIAGGCFFNKEADELKASYRYTIAAWEIGLSPKFYIPVNENIYCFLKNDFNFINLYGNIRDKNMKSSRRYTVPMSFYYSCKVGVLFDQDKYACTVWAGYTTLNLSDVLNSNRPATVERYSSQQLGFCFGLSFMF